MKNFLSVADAEIELKPLNLVFGENNAGKSTITRALKAAREGLLKGSAGSIWDSKYIKNNALQENTGLLSMVEIEGELPHAGQIIWTDERMTFEIGFRPLDLSSKFGSHDEGLVARPLRFSIGEQKDLATFINFTFEHDPLLFLIQATGAEFPDCGTKILLNRKHPSLANEDAASKLRYYVPSLCEWMDANVCEVPIKDMFVETPAIQMLLSNTFGWDSACAIMDTDEFLPSLVYDACVTPTRVNENSQSSRDKAARENRYKDLERSHKVLTDATPPLFNMSVTQLAGVGDPHDDPYANQALADLQALVRYLESAVLCLTETLIDGDRGLHYMFAMNGEFSREQIQPLESRMQLPYQFHSDELPHFLLKDGSGQKTKPEFNGLGATYLWPILFFLSHTPGNVTVIEEPEIHLHPRLQSNLGDLFTFYTNQAMRKKYSSPLIIESHSEHMLMRILRRIKEFNARNPTENVESLGGSQDVLISEDHVQVLYAVKEKQGTRFLKLRINSEGNFLDQWPPGFFDAMHNDLFESAD